MRTHMRFSGILAAALAAGTLLPVPASAGPAAGGSERYSVDWAPCSTARAVQCGTLRVPLDWSRPAGQQISLAVARRPADDPARRVGTLFYNPGGPGDGAVQYVLAADELFSRTVRERFDLVGMDPRAVGGSTRVTCEVPVLAADVTLFPRTRAQFDRLLRHNRRVGIGCLRGTGLLLGHVDTVSIARDHEALRRALGSWQVSWLGLSYGTQLAANYAQLYPRRTRAMVLDAALEHSLPEVVQVADEAMAAEDSFNRFLAWCPTAPTCALRGRDVGPLFDDLVARADRSPIPVDGALRSVTGEDIRLATIGLLRFKEPSIYGPDLSWAGLSRAIKATLNGDARPFALPPAEAAQDSLSALISIGCMEYQPQVTSYAEMRQRIRMGREVAPHLQGAAETWQVNRCIGWPVAPANPPRTLHVRGVPTLVVHATHDPSVPYKWAHSLAAQIEGSDLLTRIGDGHTSSHHSACAIAAIDRYLVRPRAIADRVCHD
jgi:pimeloyl-ACP methyl ester carboxylesterase